MGYVFLLLKTRRGCWIQFCLPNPPRRIPHRLLRCLSPQMLAAQAVMFQVLSALMSEVIETVQAVMFRVLVALMLAVLATAQAVVQTAAQKVAQPRVAAQEMVIAVTATGMRPIELAARLLVRIQRAARNWKEGNLLH